MTQLDVFTYKNRNTTAVKSFVSGYAVSLYPKLGLQRSSPALTFFRKLHAFSAASIGLSLMMSVVLVALFIQAKEPRAFERNLAAFSPKNWGADRAQFLARLTLDEKRKVASQVHYVSEIINRVNGDTNDRKELALTIVSESARSNYDPLLVTAVVKSESTFKRSAVSRSGARGLMQLLPGTAAYVKTRFDDTSARPFNLHNSSMNLHLGISYLKYLERLFNGDRELALIAYNWGPGNLLNAMKNRTPIPASTVRYARKILKNHQKWEQDFAHNSRQFQYMDIDAIA